VYLPLVHIGYESIMCLSLAMHVCHEVCSSVYEACSQKDAHCWKWLCNLSFIFFLIINSIPVYTHSSCSHYNDHRRFAAWPTSEYCIYSQRGFWVQMYWAQQSSILISLKVTMRLNYTVCWFKCTMGFCLFEITLHTDWSKFAVGVCIHPHLCLLLAHSLVKHICKHTHPDVVSSAPLPC